MIVTFHLFVLFILRMFSWIQVMKLTFLKAYIVVNVHHLSCGHVDQHIV